MSRWHADLLVFPMPGFEKVWVTQHFERNRKQIVMRRARYTPTYPRPQVHAKHPNGKEFIKYAQMRLYILEHRHCRCDSLNLGFIQGVGHLFRVLQSPSKKLFKYAHMRLYILEHRHCRYE